MHDICFGILDYTVFYCMTVCIKHAQKPEVVMILCAAISFQGMSLDATKQMNIHHCTNDHNS